MASLVIPHASYPAVTDLTQPSASTLFAQAVRDNSNLELDWLWLATQVTLATEQRYCYERALYINPASELARRALAQRPPAPLASSSEPAGAARHSSAGARTQPGFMIRWPIVTKGER